MKTILNKQVKEIHKRYVKIAEKTDVIEEEKMYRNQRVHLIEYLVDVYERDQKNDKRLKTIFPDFEQYQNIEFPYMKRHYFDTKKELVAKCFSFFRNIFYNIAEDKMKRVHAHVFMDIIRNMMLVYEMKVELHEEDMDDMFLAYDETFRPVFPEELKRIVDKRTNTQKSINS